MDKKKSVSLSTINLDDPNSIEKVENDKAVAFFCKKLPARVDSELLSRLREEAMKAGKKNIRLCLHNDPGAEFHGMIICEKKGNYYPPHKHLKNDETFHIIEGRLAVFVFDEAGDIVEALELSNENNLLFRIEKNGYHSVMPLTDLVIYHESKPGPFLGKEDSIFPVWAPDVGNFEKISEYEKTLLDALKR